LLGSVHPFNGRLRDELLNREMFSALREAQVLIEAWREEHRTHMATGSTIAAGHPQSRCTSGAAHMNIDLTAGRCSLGAVSPGWF
jgi:hypothetical protein